MQRKLSRKTTKETLRKIEERNFEGNIQKTRKETLKIRGKKLFIKT